MKFDQLFPDKKETDFEGSLMVRLDADEACWHCGRRTHWVDMNFMAYLCSEECDRAKWKEYAAADHGEFDLTDALSDQNDAEDDSPSLAVL